MQHMLILYMMKSWCRYCYGVCDNTRSWLVSIEVNYLGGVHDTLASISDHVDENVMPLAGVTIGCKKGGY